MESIIERIFRVNVGSKELRLAVDIPSASEALSLIRSLLRKEFRCRLRAEEQPYTREYKHGECDKSRPSRTPHPPTLWCEHATSTRVLYLDVIEVESPRNDDRDYHVMLSNCRLYSIPGENIRLATRTWTLLALALARGMERKQWISRCVGTSVETLYLSVSLMTMSRLGTRINSCRQSEIYIVMYTTSHLLLASFLQMVS